MSSRAHKPPPWRSSRIFGAITVCCLLIGFPVFAGTVRTIDNQTLEGAVRLEDDGTLLIETTNEGTKEVGLEKVRLAHFGLISDSNTLPKGWQAENIGQGRGSCVEKQGRFTLRATAAGPPLKEPKVQHSALFAHRLYRANGEMVARLESVAGAPSALSGIMLREHLEAPGGFLLLGVTPDLKLRVQSRESSHGNLRRGEFGAVTLPIWLRLVREEKNVSAWRSSDGQNWQRVEQTGLNFQAEPFPDGSDAWKPKFWAGVAIANPGSNTISTATFDQISFTGQGLLGMYYADSKFENLRFSRLDPKVSYWWGANAPTPELPAGRFSVRWLGDVRPKTSGTYTFMYEVEPTARLWVGGEELPPLASKEKKSKRKTREIALTGGQKYPLRLEYQSGDGSARATLSWTRKQGSEEVLEKQLSYTYDNSSPEEFSEVTRTNQLATKGIWLRNGTFLAGEIRSADDGITRIVLSGTNELVILNSKIARMVFRRLNRPPAFETVAGHTGVFIKNGDFFESEFKGVKDKRLTVSSVLFGRRGFSIEGSDVTALLLNPSAPEPARFEVKLLNGSILRANAVRGLGNIAAIEETAIGTVTLPARDLLEIKQLN